MKAYRRLCLVEREAIGELYHCGAGVRAIAGQLYRSPSTISREINRNKSGFYYLAVTADNKARPGFKKTWTTIVPKAMERSTYVLISGILMIIISLNWQSMEGMLWDVEDTAARTVLNVLHVSGWAIAVFSTFLINHFDLFGLQQVWFNFKDRPEPAPNFTERVLYKIVRHSLQLGFLMGLWLTPTMSWTPFSLSTLMTIYIFIGLHYEEKDLAASLGDSYTDYQKRVHKLIPIPV